MFRAVLCSYSGGQIVLLQHLVSSLSVNGRKVCRLRADWVRSQPAYGLASAINGHFGPEDENNSSSEKLVIAYYIKMCHISEDHYLNLHRPKYLKLQMSKSIRKANTRQDNFLLHVVWIADSNTAPMLIYAIVFEFRRLFHFIKSLAKLQVRYWPFISLVCANQIDIPFTVVSAKGRTFCANI